jgi:heme exporter protein A
MHLTAENLSVRRGEEFIFMNISFKLDGGDAMILTGKNGSGKSTLLRLVAGLLQPETGSITIAGKTVEPGMRASEACHYLGHRNAMKMELTVFENLSFWKDFLKDFPEGSAMTVEDACESVGLAGISHLPFGYLSAGQQRRFAMAKLLVAWRPIWILDEPTAALDASADRMFAGLMEDHLKKNGIVLAATHQPLAIDNAKKLHMTGFEGTEVHS